MPNPEGVRKTETPLSVLIVLDIAVLGMIGVMLMTPIGPNKAGFLPMFPGEIGFLGRLLLLPLQWLFAMMAVGFGASKIKGNEIQGSVLVFGFGIPLATVGLTLLFFWPIMRY